MKKKLKLFLSMSSMFIAIGILCFGVYAAIGVSYTISGSVAYQVKDVFVNVQTSLYMSKDTSLTNQNTLDANVAKFEVDPTTAQTQTNTEKLSYTDEFSTYAPSTGEVIKPSQEYSKTSENIPINYGAYEEGVKGYAYYIVVSITNYGTENLNVTLTNNINNEQTNSLTKLSQNLSIVGRTGEDTYTTKHIVIGMALNDATKSVDNVKFEITLKIEKRNEPEPTLDKIELVNMGDSYRVDSNELSAGDIIIPSFYNGLPVESIAMSAFYHNDKITSVVISKNIKHIEDEAFYLCNNLNVIIIESQYIYNEISGSSRYSTGGLLSNNPVVYVNKNLMGNSTYLDSDSFTKVDNGDGYWKYTKI